MEGVRLLHLEFGNVDFQFAVNKTCQEHSLFDILSLDLQYVAGSRCYRVHHTEIRTECRRMNGREGKDKF